MKYLLACAVSLLVLLAVGCEKQSLLINPEYRTETALIAKIPGADAKTIAICHFDTKDAEANPGKSYTNVAFGVGRQQMDPYKLSPTMGQTIANALAFQLRNAGFTVIVIKDTSQIGIVKSPAALIVGDMNVFRVKLLVNFLSTDISGEVKSISQMKTVDDTKTLYEKAQEFADKDSKALGINSRNWENNFASTLLTKMIDDLCKDPAFVQSLQHIAQ
ncbi:MAG TPA: hypothetical protein VGL77_08715 [Armatimonadota bacterium]|jgi:hypothetical protein